MELSETRYFGLLRSLLLALGEWPYSTSKLKYLQRLVISFMTVYFVAIQIAKFFTVECDLTLSVTIFANLLATFITISKHVKTRVNNHMVKEIFEQMKHHWRMFESKEELEILYRYDEIGRTYSLVYAFSVQLALLIVIFMQFMPLILDVVTPLNVSRPIRLPFEVEYFVDMEEYVYYILLHISLTFEVGFIFIAASDIVYIVSVWHACGLCAVIGYKLDNVFEKNCPRHFEPKKCAANASLEHCIETHKKLIEYVGVINSCHSYSFSIQYAMALISQAIFCIRIFTAIFLSRHTDQLVTEFIFIAAPSYMMVMLIIPAQALLTCSAEIFDKGYCAGWYRACTRMQKSLLIMLSNALKPCSVRFINNASMSFELSMAMLRLQMSYMAMLHSISDRLFV